MTKQELEYELALKTSECEMLNNTLMQMYKKETHKSVVDAVQSEVMSKMKEISVLSEKINNGEYDKEKVEYDFYNDVQPKKEEKCGFYDSIAKKNIAVNKCCKDEKKDNKLNIREMVDDISLCNGSISSNLFLVDLEDLGIEKDKVKSVDFDNVRNKVYITLYDHIVNSEGWGENSKATPLISLLTSVNNVGCKFNFNILHIGNDGTPIYTEKYKGAKITDIWRNDLDYSSDGFAVIRVELKYDNVQYETANTEKE